MTTEAEMIAKTVAYFADVDRFDHDAILTHFAADAVMEVPTHGTVRHGIGEIAETYRRRREMVQKSWHGDFKYMFNVADQRLAVRLTVERTLADDRAERTDNVTIIEFADGKIGRLSVWMAGANTLT